jgi:Tfp pilus assembly protein PilZ
VKACLEGAFDREPPCRRADRPRHVHQSQWQERLGRNQHFAAAQLTGGKANLLQALIDKHSAYHNALLRSEKAASEKNVAYRCDFRNSIRFPLHLQVVLKMRDGEHPAHTMNISSGGVFIQTERSIALDSELEFVIKLPDHAFGTDRPVVVNCQGRVVRCSEDVSGSAVAVIINDYQFSGI